MLIHSGVRLGAILQGRLNMLKRLEFDGVAGWAEEEHRGLFARFAFARLSLFSFAIS